ncbi:hypothetical protein EVAR_29410_1 [Eumeta japonica]|uniref:Uncharacterized protein n=1 Tax=Eumeta variegata TaxID=151549 RepID=A0A4C1VW28_EUMVA|nr:hypothetical protein EVAR_29410_1 [Eumeta japonica]
MNASQRAFNGHDSTRRGLAAATGVGARGVRGRGRRAGYFGRRPPVLYNMAAHAPPPALAAPAPRPRYNSHNNVSGRETVLGYAGSLGRQRSGPWSHQGSADRSHQGRHRARVFSPYRTEDSGLVPRVAYVKKTELVNTETRAVFTGALGSALFHRTEIDAYMTSSAAVRIAGGHARGRRAAGGGRAVSRPGVGTGLVHLHMRSYTIQSYVERQVFMFFVVDFFRRARMESRSCYTRGRLLRGGREGNLEEGEVERRGGGAAAPAHGNRKLTEHATNSPCDLTSEHRLSFQRGLSSALALCQAASLASGQIDLPCAGQREKMASRIFDMRQRRRARTPPPLPRLRSTLTRGYCFLRFLPTVDVLERQQCKKKNIRTD